MSRYRVEESTTAGKINIYDSNGWIAGQIYWAGQPESERLKRFIEAHDEIMNILCRLAYADEKWLAYRACIDDLVGITKRIDGEEAQ